MTKIVRINHQHLEVTAQEAFKLALAGEAVLVESDPELAYYYAQNVIGGSWSLGEAAMAKDPKWAYHYALNVIKGPWPPGEAAISGDF
ncbi:MAG: hypothetical protein ACRC16_22090, partial [Aeromonas salmonicida]